MQEDYRKLQLWAKKLPEPENLYEGEALPQNFELPDEILLFYHDYCAATPNAHQRYTLVFPFSEMHYFVEQNHYLLQPGQMLIIYPHQMRFLSPKSSGYERLFITFSLKTVQFYLPSPGVCQLDPLACSQLELIRDACFDCGGALLHLRLFEFLNRLSGSVPHNSEKRLSLQISRAIEYINGERGCELNLRTLAGKLHMSESNLRRRFKLETGLSVKNYIHRQRQEIARYYLQKTFTGVDEIAEKCGFQSAAAFCHFFKMQTGFSPLQYRFASGDRAAKERKYDDSEKE